MRALFLGGPWDREQSQVADDPPDTLQAPLPQSPRDGDLLLQMIREAYGPLLRQHGFDPPDRSTYTLVAHGEAGAVYATLGVDPDMAEDYAHDPDLWDPEG